MFCMIYLYVIWEIVVKHRRSWHAYIHKGATQSETDHISQTKQKCQQRKDHLLHLPDTLTAATRTCPICQHAFITNCTHQSFTT